MFGNKKYNVKKAALKTKRYITNGLPHISKNTLELKKSEKGLKASSIFWSKPLPCEKTGSVNRIKKRN